MSFTEVCITRSEDFGAARRRRREGTYRGSNLPSTGSRVSCEAGSHLHFRIAVWAASVRSGCPPLTSRDFTLPLVATKASSFTVPLTFIRRARSGYAGTIRITTLRLLSDVCCWASDNVDGSANIEQRANIATVVRRNIMGGTDIWSLHRAGSMVKDDDGNHRQFEK